MATRLEKTIKRELELGEKLYTVSIGPEGLKITPKGGRKGAEFSWPQLIRELEGGSAGPTGFGG